MADVRVGQKDSVGKTSEPRDLTLEVGRGVDQEPFSGGAVDQAERGDGLSLRRVAARFDTELLAASEVGHAPVLRDPEDDGLDAGRDPGGSRERLKTGRGGPEPMH